MKKLNLGLYCKNLVQTTFSKKLLLSFEGYIKKENIRYASLA